MNISEIYANVVDRHPTLAVPELIDPGHGLMWEHRGEACSIGDDIAIALIVDHWTEYLPSNHGLMRCPFDVWSVIGPDESGEEAFLPDRTSVETSRIEALAAFWLTYNGKIYEKTK